MKVRITREVMTRNRRDRPILVRLDGTAIAGRAIPASISLARQLDCRLLLICVADPEAGLAAAQLLMLAYLEEHAKQARAREVDCGLLITEGEPVEPRGQLSCRWMDPSGPR